MKDAEEGLLEVNLDPGQGIWTKWMGGGGLNLGGRNSGIAMQSESNLGSLPGPPKPQGAGSCLPLQLCNTSHSSYCLLDFLVFAFAALPGLFSPVNCSSASHRAPVLSSSHLKFVEACPTTIPT